jgi:hypothetical protein
MSLLDDDLYGDVDQFLETYGSDTPTLEQIRALQVRPWMLCWPPAFGPMPLSFSFYSRRVESCAA